MSDTARDGNLSHAFDGIATPISRGTLLRGAAGVGAGLLGAGLLPAGAMQSGAALAAQSRAKPVTIEVWYPYSGTNLPNFLKLFTYFQSSHPDITIKGTYAANDLSSNQKLFAAVAAGLPPDVTWVDGPEVAGWGFRGILQPIDKYMKKAGLTAADFWSPCWKEIQYGGHFWALPFSADPNFGFYWNKELFAKAGIHQPPRTFDEMNRMAQELTVVKGGNIQQAGLIPWNVYSYANSMYTWGWVFGGSFFDQARNKVTANDPPIVAALEWMVSYAKKYNITRFGSFLAPFGGTAGNVPLSQVFALGKLAMQPLGPWEIPNIKQYNPSMQYGITKMPAYKNVPSSSWVGGWCIGIPRGAKNPDAAFEFIRWISASNDGTTKVGNALAQFPGYKKSPFFDTLSGTLKTFYPILQTTQHQRPVTPAEDYYVGQLLNEVSNALYGKKTPKKALDDVTKNVQSYLNGILKKKG
jgi:multiple sugar transport system substrate-binding protein